MNCELQKLYQWLRVNKLTLNVTDTNYMLFHAHSTKDALHLKMSELKIGNSTTKRKSSVNIG